MQKPCLAVLALLANFAKRAFDSFTDFLKIVGGVIFQFLRFLQKSCLAVLVLLANFAKMGFEQIRQILKQILKHPHPSHPPQVGEVIKVPYLPLKFGFEMR